MENDFQLAAEYLPDFYQDRNEPFSIAAVGFEVLRQSGHSPSFDRELELSGECAAVVEYAIYFDFDIQHTYDLEHVWIYLNSKGEICDAECSAHGGYFNCFRLREEPEHPHRLKLYMQPGKHAFMPAGRLFALYPNYRYVCGEGVGKDGLLVPPFLREKLHKTEAVDRAVHTYMQARYRFEPTLDFVPATCGSKLLMPVAELIQVIPQRIERLLREQINPKQGETV